MTVVEGSQRGAVRAAQAWISSLAGQVASVSASVATVSSSVTTATATANAAASDASNALTLANAAQTAANGKNKVFYAVSAPTATTTGDLWFQTSAGTVVSMSEWSGSAWVQQPLTSAMFASIDAGKITTGTLTGINIIGTFIETAANVGTGTSPSVVPGVLLNTSGQLFCYSATGPKLVFDGTNLTLTSGTLTSPSVTGGTLTGSVIQTATSGSRIVISPTFAAAAHFYTGTGSESSPANIANLDTSGTPELQIVSSSYSSHAVAEIVVAGSTSSTDNSSVSVSASSFVVGASLSVSGGSVFFPSLPSSSTATAVGVGPIGGLNKLTSSRRYKTSIRPMTLDAARKALDLQAITYRSKSDADDKRRRFWGFIAEDANDVTPQLVALNEDGQPESFDYARLTVAHNLLLADLHERLQKAGL